MYDLIILGGGPAGYNAAERAAQGGMKVLLFEGRALGGVCLNEGCIPTKTLLYSAKIYDYAKHSAEYGVTFDGAKIDHSAVLARKAKVVKMLVGGLDSYRVQAVFSCCKYYTAKNLFCQVFFERFFAVFQLQPR